jgi:hypothetical protein
MKEIIGKNWFFKILLLVIVGTWPIVVFYNKIDFDPAKFTEEWIKTFITVIVIGLIIKFYDRIINKRKHEIDTNSIKSNIISIIDDFKFSVKNINELLNLISIIKSYGYLTDIDVAFLMNIADKLKQNNPHLTEGDKIKTLSILDKIREQMI